MAISYFNVFEDSVEKLASKLPQWNSEDIDRRVQSAIASLFEEAGELCGYVSKKRIRKNYWKANPKDLDDYYKIREKFIDETGDLLWVIVCSIQCLIGKNEIDIEKLLTSTEEIYNVDFENSLFDIVRDISTLRQTLMFEDNDTKSLNIIYNFNCLLSSFRVFLYNLNEEYDVSLNKILEYNLNKLKVRYDNEGQRVDGK